MLLADRNDSSHLIGKQLKVNIFDISEVNLKDPYIMHFLSKNEFSHGGPGRANSKKSASSTNCT